MFEKPLGLRENPFLAGHNPKYLFPSREHQEALAHLRYGIQNREPFVLITGEVGTGKTTAVYDALAEWGSRALVALITNSALTRGELLEEICLRFGVTVPSPLSKPHALVELQKQLSAVRERGELAILLVDEAQNLDRELLEEIRLLSNLEVSGEYLLQIFLVGQSELESKLAQKELRQLRQRIGIHYRILPLSGTETARYIHHRVSVAGGNSDELFPADTCVEIFRITNGIPREINIVAGQSLLNAFVEDSRTVTIAHVRAVEREIEFQSVLRHQSGGVAEKADPGSEGKPRKPGPATILPIAPAHAAAELERPREAPAPPLEHLAGASVDESDDVEVTESAFGEALPDADDALADEFPYDDGARLADDEIGETTAVGTGRAKGDPILPSWIDEIVTRRQTTEEWAAAPPPAASQPSSVPTPPPLALEPPADFGPPAPTQPSGAMLAAPAPERTLLPPAEPIPLFGRNNDSLPPRLRNKLAAAESEESERTSFRAWPMASLVIAAIAIAVLLVVRFSPWTVQRRTTVPATAPAPAGSPDSSADSAGPFPPLDGMGEGRGATAMTAAPIDRQAPSAASRDSAGAPVAAMGEPALSGSANPQPDALPRPMTPDPASTQLARGGATGEPAPPGAGPALTVAPSFGIAVGTYLNEGRASTERTRLAESTNLATQVVTVAEDAVSMYRVVVGSYTSRGSAERAASDLVQRGLVIEARVVAIEQPVSTRP